MSTRTRRIAVIAVGLLVMTILPGCELWGVALGADPGTSTTALQIVAPATQTQVAGRPNVAVEVRVNDQVDRSTLVVTLRTGPGFATVVQLRPRLAFTGDRARGTVALSELREGLSTITARAEVGPSDAVQTVDTAFSYEPWLTVADAARCEVLGQSRCFLPFPNDRWTRPSGTTDTGRLVDIQAGTMPANASGTPFDPTEWNRNDGFSPGSPLVAHIPGLDVAQSKLPTIGRMADYDNADAGVVVIDTATGERWPVWAELDAWATADATRALIIRPAKNFLEGHHYVVGLRNLRTAAGAPIPVHREFQVVRDSIPTFTPVDARWLELAGDLGVLDRAGVARGSLNLAWEFTVASERNLSERVLRMRDDAYAQLGTAQPAFTVTSVTDNPSSSVWRRVQGTFDVPLYLAGTGQPGSRLNNGTDGLPRRNGTYKANFICNIPKSVYSGTGSVVTPGRALVYGHGLLGGAGEVNSFGPLHNTHRFVGCATDEIGMSSADIGNVFQILGDISKFPSLADRLQQSMINFQFLAKLMKSGGFSTNAAFRAGPASAPTIETGSVFYNGNSQGGILGGAVTAISKEWTRAALGVPAMNFSNLLTRSVHWDTFSPTLYNAYPDELARTMGYSLIQMLWDRGEANGYAQHLTTDPLPGTPAHQVLLIEAFGDHQVANVATETEARTIGARLWTPALRAGRTDLAEPFFGLAPVGSTPYADSVLVVWDYGTPAPPQQNLPPRPPQYGSDPHGAGSGEPRVGQQVSNFLRVGGTFTDQCAGGPCFRP